MTAIRRTNTMTKRWPENNALQDMTKVPKITAINYKTRDDNYVLTSIQLVFDFGDLKSEWFETPDAIQNGWT